MAYFGLSAKNTEQKRVLQAAANDKPFLFVTGPSGCGKTLTVQAVGLNSVIESRDHRKLIYTRLQEQVGKDLGFLPGSIDEKNFPFIAPFMDNLEVLTEKPSEILRMFGAEGGDKQRIYFDTIQMMRGRSLNHTFVMIDEAQNLDLSTIAALGTRPANNTKIVFIGNFAQTDNPALRTPETNGFYKLLHGLYEKGAHKYFDHVNLTETQRNPVVEIVEDILRNHEMPIEFEDLELRGNVVEW